jgi:hypothetical protein
MITENHPSERLQTATEVVPETILHSHTNRLKKNLAEFKEHLNRQEAILNRLNGSAPELPIAEDCSIAPGDLNELEDTISFLESLNSRLNAYSNTLNQI